LAGLSTGLAGCDRLLVDPAPPRTSSISLALSPTKPSFAVAPANANEVRVQVLDGSRVLFDAILPFDPDQEEITVPVRFTGSEAVVTIRVQVSEDARPLLRGSTEVRLLQSRVTEAEVNLVG